MSEERRFQKDNVKYSKTGIMDIYNADGHSFKKDDKDLEKFNELKDKWKTMISYWRKYPDHLANLYGINLHGYQRLLLRVIFRYRYVYIIASRGGTKSWLSVLALFLQCILYPRLKVGMTAGGKEQAVGIIKEKVNELKEYPLLKREIKRIENNKDHYSVHFQNGSVFKVAIAGEATRGKRFNRLLLDENRLIKKEIMETILIPTLIIKRQLPNGTVDPDELNHQELYLTSAYFKSHDCYRKFVSFTKDMVKKDNVFVCAFGWEIPVMYGLFDEEYLQELKEKDDYNPLTHAMEYEAKFMGISDNAFFNLDEILQCRVHKLPELKKDEKIKDKDVIYVAGVDIARAPDRSNWANDLTSISVLKCVPKKDGSYISTLVYQRTLQGIHFQDQANIIRLLVTDYDLRAIAMDVKGIAGGLLDFLNIPYGDFPPIVSMNDDLDKPLIQDGVITIILFMQNNNDRKYSAYNASCM